LIYTIYKNERCVISRLFDLIILIIRLKTSVFSSISTLGVELHLFFFAALNPFIALGSEKKAPLVRLGQSIIWTISGQSIKALFLP
jgi:hypothetical protein